MVNDIYKKVLYSTLSVAGPLVLHLHDPPLQETSFSNLEVPTKKQLWLFQYGSSLKSDIGNGRDCGSIHFFLVGKDWHTRESTGDE